MYPLIDDKNLPLSPLAKLPALRRQPVDIAMPIKYIDRVIGNRF